MNRSCECSDSEQEEFERLEREAGGHHPQEQRGSPSGHDDYNRLMAQVQQQEQQLHTPQATSCECSDSDSEFERLEREAGGHHHHGQRGSPSGHDDHRRLMEQVRQQEQQLYSSPQATSCACPDPELEEFERHERATGGHHHHGQRRSPTGHDDDHRRLMEQVRQQEQQLYSSPAPAQRSRPHSPQRCACEDPELDEFERHEREIGGHHHRHGQRRSPTGHDDDHRRLMEQVRQQEQQLYSSPPPAQRSRPRTPQGTGHDDYRRLMEQVRQQEQQLYASPQATSCACPDPELEEFERHEREIGGHHRHHGQRRSPTGHDDDHRRLMEQVRQQEQQLYSSTPPAHRSRPRTPQGTGHDDYRRLMEQVRQQEQELYSVPPPAPRPQRRRQQHPRPSSLPRRIPVQHDPHALQPSRSQSRIPCPSRAAPQSTRAPHRHPSRTPQPQCSCPTRTPVPHHHHHHHDAGRSGIPQPTRSRTRVAPPPQQQPQSRIPCPVRSVSAPRTPGRSTGATPRRPQSGPQSPATPVNMLNVRPANRELEAEFEGMDELDAMLLRATRLPSPTMAAALARWAPMARSPTPAWLRRPIQIPLTSSQRHILDGYEPAVSPVDEGASWEERFHEGPSPPHMSQETLGDERESPAHGSRTSSPQTCWSPGQRERLHGPREQIQFQFHSPVQAADRYRPQGSPIDEWGETSFDGPSHPHISQETIEFPPSPPMLGDERVSPAHRSGTPSPQTCWSPGQRERLYGPREQIQFQFHSPIQAADRYRPQGSPIDEWGETWFDGPSPPHISQESIEFPSSPPMLDDEWETSGYNRSKSPCECQ